MCLYVIIHVIIRMYDSVVAEVSGAASHVSHTGVRRHLCGRLRGGAEGGPGGPRSEF